MLLKEKIPSLPRNLPREFWQISNSILNKCKSAIHALFNRLKVLQSSSDKEKLFAKNFSKNSNLDDSSYSTWYIQGIQQSLTCWSSSRT